MIRTALDTALLVVFTAYTAATYAACVPAVDRWMRRRHVNDTTAVRAVLPHWALFGQQFGIFDLIVHAVDSAATRPRRMRVTPAREYRWRRALWNPELRTDQTCYILCFRLLALRSHLPEIHGRVPAVHRLTRMVRARASRRIRRHRPLRHRCVPGDVDVNAADMRRVASPGDQGSALEVSAAELGDVPLDAAVRLICAAAVLTCIELIVGLKSLVTLRSPRPSRLSVAMTAAVLVVGASAGISGVVLGASRDISAVLLLQAAVVVFYVARLSPAGDAADVMLILLSVGTGILLGEPRGSPVSTITATVLVANIALAYVWSGVSKIRQRAWRSGRQLALILNTEMYGARTPAKLLLDHGRLAQLLVWTVLTIEISVPVWIAVGGIPLLVWASAAAVMHLGIALVMGLNRFLLVFCAALLILLSVAG